MSNAYAYHVVDVFTQEPLAGNSLAVFPRADALETERMQKIARELNLSETTFVFPASDPRAAARVRIFTPLVEMEFAGHPTLGTAAVMRSAGIVDASARALTLHENVSLVDVRVDEAADPIFWLTTPSLQWGQTYGRVAAAGALGLAESDLLGDLVPQHITAGNPAIFIALRDRASVDRVRIDANDLRAMVAPAVRAPCVFAFAPTPEGAYSRMFAPDLGITEDPASGSLTGPLAAFMMRHGLASDRDGARFVSEQGTRLGRRSLLHVLVHGVAGTHGIEIGGDVRPLAIGEMRL